MTLGQKIREERRARGWTQSELAGEEITRNMLSRIESGAALPSLPTLTYLADRFGLPAGYFLTEGEDRIAHEKLLHFPAILAAYRAKNYKEAVRLYRRDFTESDDELAFVVANSALYCTRDEMHRGHMKKANEYLSLAATLMEGSAYTTDAMRAVRALLDAILTNVQAPRFALVGSNYEALAADAVWEETYRYFSEKTEGYRFGDDVLAQHTAARKLIGEGKYTDAVKALGEIETRRADPHFSVLVLFRLYGDLEVCYKELGNFEEAYRYSSKRMSLLSAFRG
ncbi:MAG: helix-turn-helix transcriptional regulator [Clostridia bacterium]|nr:helix-turn-helix transcriptional regulator [Clostridia bacterium]